MDQKTSGLAIAALVLGIIGFLTCWFPLFGLLMPIIAIILGFIAIGKINNNPELSGKGLAIGGIVLGFLGLAFSALMTIGALAYFGMLSPRNFLPEESNMMVSRCDFPAGVDCIEAPIITPSSVSFKVTNSMGSDITITALKGDATGDCIADNDIDDMTMTDGETAILTYKPAKDFQEGSNVKCKLIIEFHTNEGQFPHMLNGYISGRVKS